MHTRNVSSLQRSTTPTQTDVIQKQKRALTTPTQTDVIEKQKRALDYLGFSYSI